RYETSYARQFTRALNTLIKLRAQLAAADAELLDTTPIIVTWVDPKPKPEEEVVLRNEPSNALKTITPLSPPAREADPPADPEPDLPEVASAPPLMYDAQRQGVPSHPLSFIDGEPQHA